MCNNIPFSSALPTSRDCVELSKDAVCLWAFVCASRCGAFQRVFFNTVVAGTTGCVGCTTPSVVESAL